MVSLSLSFACSHFASTDSHSESYTHRACSSFSLLAHARLGSLSVCPHVTGCVVLELERAVRQTFLKITSNHLYLDLCVKPPSLFH